MSRNTPEVKRWPDSAESRYIYIYTIPFLLINLVNISWSKKHCCIDVALVFLVFQTFMLHFYFGSCQLQILLKSVFFHWISTFQFFTWMHLWLQIVISLCVVNYYNECIELVLHFSNFETCRAHFRFVSMFSNLCVSFLFLFSHEHLLMQQTQLHWTWPVCAKSIYIWSEHPVVTGEGSLTAILWFRQNLYVITPFGEHDPPKHCFWFFLCLRSPKFLSLSVVSVVAIKFYQLLSSILPEERKGNEETNTTELISLSFFFHFRPLSAFLCCLCWKYLFSCLCYQVCYQLF